MAQRWHYVVHGRVQGVNFRRFARDKAKEAGVTGWCRNTRDGKVEVEAQGHEDAINQFLKEIKEGPTHAYVNRVEPRQLDVRDDEEAFVMYRH